MVSQSIRTFLSRAIDGAKTLEIFVKGVGPLVAVIWIVCQYQQSRIDKRVESTLEYVKQFESDGTSIGKAQRALTDALWQHSEEIAEFHLTRATQEQIRDINRNIVLRVIETADSKVKNSNVIGTVEEIDDFFNLLATCIEGSICDQKSAMRYFGCTVEGYINLLEPISFEKTNAAHNFGWGLQWVLKRTPKEYSCSR
jgi:hypothetical protein